MVSYGNSEFYGSKDLHMDTVSTPTQPPMTSEKLLTLLRTEARRIATFAPDAVWYVFGSAIGAFHRASDIDVLVLCNNDDEAIIVRQELREACVAHPLHLFLVTRDEESQFKFITTQPCMKLYP
jgi:predicted nucleotidyltransferase